MYKLKGFMFVQGRTVPIRDDILVESWEEAHAVIAKAKVQHYLITLIKKENK